MQGTYNCIPETNHVSRVYNVAAILWLQFTVDVMLFPMLFTSHSLCAVPNMAVSSSAFPIHDSGTV